MRKPSILFSSLLQTLTVLGLNFAQPAFSHGYVNSPESRSFFCNQGGNTNCGSVQFEPQSVEGADGFPEAGAPDGTIAAAGKNEWAPLNDQTAERWKKRGINSGRNSFSWHFTAPHVTKGFQYYITKANWNPNQKLSRSSFDLIPFCTIDGGMVQPPFDVTHDCVVPARQGYHIILALWDVGDTAATFYQVIDVQFGGNNAPDQAKPVPPPVTPTKPAKPAPDCNTSPAPGPKLCQAKPGSAATDQWCNTNCNHNPSFCPADLCACADDKSKLTPSKPGASQGFKNCSAVPGSGADNSWCNINCNNNPEFCPDNFCRCS